MAKEEPPNFVPPNFVPPNLLNQENVCLIPPT